MRRLVIETSAASARFRQLWSGTRDVRGKTRAAKAFHHDAVGDLVLDHHAFDVRGVPGSQLVVYHAAPLSPSTDKLQLPAPGRGRAGEVSG